MSLLKYIIEDKRKKEYRRYKTYSKRTYIIDAELANRLKQIAAEMGVSTSYIIRELVKAFISEYEKEQLQKSI